MMQGDSRGPEGIKYVHEGLEHLLYNLTKQAESPFDVITNELFSTDLIKITNIQCLQAFLMLGEKIAQSKDSLPSHFFHPEEVFRTVASFAVEALCLVKYQGELYHQIERILFKAHSDFIQTMVNQKGRNETKQTMVDQKVRNDTKIDDSLIANHCDRLSSFLKVLSSPTDYVMLKLNEKVGDETKQHIFIDFIWKLFFFRLVNRLSFFDLATVELFTCLVMCCCLSTIMTYTATVTTTTTTIGCIVGRRRKMLPCQHGAGRKGE